MNLLFRLYRILIQTLCVPIFMEDFFAKETGAEYGVNFRLKLNLLYKMIRNNMRIISGSTFLEHLTMATSLLRLPRSVEGAIVECGTYKGVSAANISLVCKLMGRQLVIFDSFEGLPEPSEKDKTHYLLANKEMHTYEKGSWCGRLDEVKDNITRFGEISVCEFVKGYFENTLPSFREKCVQAFLDVDYRDSLEDCVRYLWPLLQDGCLLYTHEAGHMEIASLFFSEKWWVENLRTVPPGLVGAGTGLGLKILSGSYFNSSLGFTIKNPEKAQFTHMPQIGGMKLGFEAAAKLTAPASHP